jgi:hypothetical protein
LPISASCAQHVQPKAQTATARARTIIRTIMFYSNSPARNRRSNTVAFD